MAKLSIFIPFPDSIKNKKDQVKIADALINHIVGRTMAGKNKNNRKFPKYNKDYAELKGVGVNDVDLVLEGEMLTELKAIDVGPDGIEIGYEGSDALIGKVEGNILGTYGQPQPIPGKARDFLGIPQKDVDVIVSAYQDEEESGYVSQDDLDAIARQAAEEILGEIDWGLDE